MQKKYVVGFLFRPKDKAVALIQKNKPQWQAGKLNGIGGKIEDGETPLDAMIREFEEETGALVTDWEPFLIARYKEAEVHFFKSDFGHEVSLRNTTDEKVNWFLYETVTCGPISPKPPLAYPDGA